VCGPTTSVWAPALVDGSPKGGASTAVGPRAPERSRAPRATVCAYRRSAELSPNTRAYRRGASPRSAYLRSRAGNSREHQCFTQPSGAPSSAICVRPGVRSVVPECAPSTGAASITRITPVRCRSRATYVASSAVSVMVTVTSAPRAAAMRSRVGRLGEIRPLSRRAIADWVVPTSLASCR
jgi:hypothetical protein